MGSSAAEIDQLLQAARLHLAKGEFHEAIEQASEAIRRDSRQPAAYLVRAEAHRKLKRADRALADLAVAIRLDPNQPGPYVIRAEVLKRRNIFDQAIADASHAIIIDPRSAAAYSIRAECRSAIGDQEGAIEDVQEMVRIDPTRPVPNLRAKAVSGDARPSMELDDEQFWKQSGRKPSNDTTVFADGKPVDKTYRARRAVSDEEAPEALGVASGYKPGTISRPIPRMREQARKSLGHGGVGVLGIGVTIIAGCCLWMVFRGTPEPTTKTARPRPSQVDRSIAEPTAPVSARPPAAVPSRPIADAVATGLPRNTGPRPPDDAVAFNGHAYKFFPEVLPWHRAKARCEEMGGRLPIVGSRAENDFVMNLALRGITSPGPMDGVWLGATDEHKEGDWEWVDGSTLSFTMWAPGQPNNKQNREHYLLLWLPKNVWADQPNESTQHVAYFVCEWDGEPSGQVDSKPARGDSGLLQGEWVMVDEETNGVPDKITRERRIMITGDDFVMSRTRNGQHGVYVGKISIDQAARTFDFEGKGPQGGHRVFKGIYDLDGDTLRMCYTYIEGRAFERPTRLRSYQLPNTTMVSLVLKRLSGTRTSSAPQHGTTPTIANAVPEMANVHEVNSPGKDFCPWLSPDGLIIYWVLEPSGSEGEIWTAHRKDPSALFTDKRQVGYGRHVAVSSDGLTAFLIARKADGKSGDSVQVAKRSSPAESFGRSREVPELRSIQKPRNLFLSQDGLTLLFNEGDDDTFRLSMVTRRSPQLSWETPRAIPVSSRVTFDGLALCPYLTRDELTLFFNVQNAAGPRLLMMSRKTVTQPFDKPIVLSLPDVKELVGWMPRFVEATKELFFCSTKLSPAGNMDIWVTRNFDPLPNAEDRSNIQKSKN